jgi:lipid II:glycine glycyltransferase (peptidoglycan interpeptide bridge formation enzyme)
MEGEAIRGILPMMYIQIDGGKVFNSLPYYGSNGGIIADNEQAYTELIDAYNQIAYDKTTLSSTIITNPLNQRDPTGIAYNYTDYRIGQLTHLSKDNDNWEGLLSRLVSSARRNVKKAIKDGVTVEIDHSKLNQLREMHQENIQAIGGIPKSDAFFRLISEFFLPGKDFNLYMAKRDGIVIAGLLIFYFNRTVEYFTPAIDSEYRSLQPLSLIIMTAMTEAAKSGFKYWNWGGTWKTQTGVYRFKKKWATLEQKYFYYTQLNDRSILNWSQDKIVRTFPNFFIIPFSQIDKGEPKS